MERPEYLIKYWNYTKEKYEERMVHWFPIVYTKFITDETLEDIMVVEVKLINKDSMIKLGNGKI